MNRCGNFDKNKLFTTLIFPTAETFQLLLILKMRGKLTFLQIPNAVCSMESQEKMSTFNFIYFNCLK